jgi:hypothetical protein
MEAAGVLASYYGHDELYDNIGHEGVHVLLNKSSITMTSDVAASASRIVCSESCSNAMDLC